MELDDKLKEEISTRSIEDLIGYVIHYSRNPLHKTKAIVTLLEQDEIEIKELLPMLKKANEQVLFQHDILKYWLDNFKKQPWREDKEKLSTFKKNLKNVDVEGILGILFHESRSMISSLRGALQLINENQINQGEKTKLLKALPNTVENLDALFNILHIWREVQNTAPSKQE